MARTGAPRRVGLALLAGALIVAATAGCGYLWMLITGPSVPANASLTVEARAEGSDLIVWGATDLPDGTIIELWVADTRRGSYKSTDTIFLVASGGRYDTRISVTGWRQGEIVVVAAFAPDADGQRNELRERFGPHGEQLRGPNVMSGNGESWFLEVSTHVTIPGR